MINQLLPKNYKETNVELVKVRAILLPIQKINLFNKFIMSYNKQLSEKLAHLKRINNRTDGKNSDKNHKLFLICLEEVKKNI